MVMYEPRGAAIGRIGALLASGEHDMLFDALLHAVAEEEGGVSPRDPMLKAAARDARWERDLLTFVGDGIETFSTYLLPQIGCMAVVLEGDGAGFVAGIFPPDSPPAAYVDAIERVLVEHWGTAPLPTRIVNHEPACLSRDMIAALFRQIDPSTRGYREFDAAFNEVYQEQPSENRGPAYASPLAAPTA